MGPFHSFVYTKKERICIQLCQNRIFRISQLHMEKIYKIHMKKIFNHRKILRHTMHNLLLASTRLSKIKVVSCLDPSTNSAYINEINRLAAPDKSPVGILAT